LLCILYGDSTCSTVWGQQGVRRWWAEETSHAVACTTRAGVGGTRCKCLEAQRRRSLPTFVSQDMLLIVRPALLTCNCAGAYTTRCVSAPVHALQAGEERLAIPCAAAPSIVSMPRRLIVQRVSVIHGSCGYVVRVHEPLPVPCLRVVTPVTRLV